MKLEIRRFSDTDRAAVIALWREVFADDPPWNEPEAIIARKVGVQSDLFLVGEVGGTIVATVLAGFDGVRGWVYHLAVASALRRRGIATRMVREAETRLAELGCPKINLQIRARTLRRSRFIELLGMKSRSA